MAQGIGYNPSFYRDDDDEITSGFRRYEKDVEHSQNLVIHGFGDDFQDPIQVGLNHQEVPHEEYQMVAREESPVPQQSFQYDDLDQWDHENENRDENHESPRQQEPSQQIQQSEDQDYQVEYPQYQDEEFLKHQQMQHVVHQQDFLKYKDSDQLKYDKKNRFDYQQLAHQQQPPQQLEHSAQVNYQLEYSVANKGNQMNPRQERQMVWQQRPTQSHQMTTNQVCQMEHQVEGLPIQQTRPQQQKDRKVNPQPACSQHEIELFDAPQPQVQRTGPLFFSPLEHPLNGVSKWKNQLLDGIRGSTS